MRLHAIRYCLEEALASLWRQRWSAGLSVLAIAAALLVLGVFLLVTVNLDRAVARWSAAAEFSVYLRDDIAQDQRAALNAMLEGHPAVASRDYVSKADAARRFARDFPDLAEGLAELPQNPLPASIEVRLRAGRTDSATVDALAQQLRGAAGVADVRFDRRWLERLGGIVKGLAWAGWMLGAVLLTAAILTVATVVRLALHARRDEVDIMQLMGAPIGLLRGPLVAEGLLQGGAGALVALAALYGTYVAVRGRLTEAIGPSLDPGLVGFLPGGLVVLVLVGGMAVGCAGGYVAARQVR
ncbi:MAG TPA: permease-like cell division protein FtsX [Vicinamibacterales bacterium]|nr:permease-like cell division protein FtsX [Vicinamibacterales bacterium]HPW22103.1 permease-like cell division protein FtsX [Vicinamibacterales bacterium]